MQLREAKAEDLRAASDLCLRSKAHWGYDAAFLAACRAELTLTPGDLLTDRLVIAGAPPCMAGVAQVSLGKDGCYLEKLFVDPEHMGKGVGRLLFDWSVATARQFGAGEMIVEADPQAAPFYIHLGCRPAGTAMSGSLPGRTLPRLIVDISGAAPAQCKPR